MTSSVADDPLPISGDSGRDLRSSALVRRVGSLWGSARAAAITFGAAVLVALPLIVFWGRHNWFVIDDWDFLMLRTAGNVGDLFRPHAGHWSTLPFLLYRGLWNVVGLRYEPFQLVVIVLHLATAVLVRMVMRRCGIEPWLATLAALVFLFFGAGSPNIVLAFQMIAVAPLVFGFVHLRLATHDGGIDRRDALGLLSGLAALMCSGVGIAMAVAVGVAALLYRGWRVALLHTAPLAVAYSAWFAAIGHRKAPQSLGNLGVSDMAHFVTAEAEATFGGIGQLPGLGLVWALILPVGIGLLIWRTRRGQARRGEWSLGTASALGLTAGAVAYLFTTALARSAPLSGFAAATFGTRSTFQPRAGRYVYVMAALLLPALVLAAQTIARAWRPAAALVAAMLLISLAGNVNTLSSLPAQPYLKGLQRTMLIVPRLPPAQLPPDSLVVAPVQSLATVGWLRANARAGRIPDPGPFTEVDISNTILILSFNRLPSAQLKECTTLSSETVVVLRPGDGFRVRTGPFAVTYAPLSGARSQRTILVRGGSVQDVFQQPLRLEVGPAGTRSVSLCTRSGARIAGLDSTASEG